ncbi:hypothetical protein PABG_12401 [Paracoccidioides brasiliensis Pb03]|nr:hypothetical protein PABG_12401 [Paracoccidioides brasiliensis Pb03]
MAQSMLDLIGCKEASRAGMFPESIRNPKCSGEGDTACADVLWLGVLPELQEPATNHHRAL